MPTRPPVHHGVGYQTKQERDRDRDRLRRKAGKLYDLARWRDHLRPAFLAAHPLCAECQRKGLLAAATEVHHLHGHDGRMDPAAWAWANLEALCRPCHSAITVRELHAGRR